MEKDIVITKKVSGKLPFANLDYEKMEQAVINLLLNAVEAVDREGRIHITAGSGRGRAKTLRLQITDNGHGIDPENMPYIFDPFFSGKSKGTGLGLANAKKIVEAHGGRIEVSPAEPAGTRVILTIPVGEGHERRQ
jgi:signal transduction histidine kinase